MTSDPLPHPEIDPSEGLALIAEAQANSLDLLFSKPPEDWEEKDLSEMVTYYQTRRHQFTLEEAAGKTKSKVKKAPGQPKLSKQDLLA